MISIFGREVGEYPEILFERRNPYRRETEGIPYGRGEDNILCGREEGRDHNMEEGRMISPVSGAQFGRGEVIPYGRGRGSLCVGRKR